jgi:hypothetical protein
MTTPSVGILEAQNRVVEVLTGAEFAADLVAARLKYAMDYAELPPPSGEGIDVFRFETLEGNAWPVFMVPFDRHVYTQWGSANIATVEFFFKFIVGCRVDGGQFPRALRMCQAYMDAAAATITRAMRQTGANANIFDSKPIESSMGAALASTAGDSIVQFGSITFSLRAKTSTETV